MKTEIFNYVVRKINPVVSLYPEISGKIGSLFLVAMDLINEKNFFMIVLEPINQLELNIKELASSKKLELNPLLIHDLKKAIFSLSKINSSDEKEKIFSYFMSLKSKFMSLEIFLCEELKVTSGTSSSGDMALGLMNMEMAVMSNENFELQARISRKDLENAVFKYFEEQGGSAELDSSYGFKYQMGDKSGYITVTYLNYSVMISLM